MRNSLILLVLVVSTLCGCDSSEEKEEALDPQQFTNDEGGLRGAEMGDNIRKIMARESNHIVHQMPDELTARIPINQKDSTYYEITYNFNEGGLYVIDMDIFPKDSIDGRVIFEQFESYYIRRHGPPIREGNAFQWNTFSARQTKVQITMSDLGLRRSKPAISITFFEEQE